MGDWRPPVCLFVCLIHHFETSGVFGYEIEDDGDERDQNYLCNSAFFIFHFKMVLSSFCYDPIEGNQASSVYTDPSINKN